MNAKQPLVLGIESTCDETGVAFVRGTTELLGDVTATSMDEYARYGGIIPEIASRAHLESFLPTLSAAVEKAGVQLADVDAIGVAAGPGLIGSLGVGISAAKALAFALGKPLYGVNHVLGHLFVDQLVNGPLPLPCLGLIVSGGHTNLLLINSATPGGVKELGGTLDDAAGEAFDKVGRLLGLPYPGGPHVDRLAASAPDKNAIVFPRGLSGAKYERTHPYDFSLSGLKTAVLRRVQTLEADAEIDPNFEANPAGKPWLPVAELCAGLSESVNDSLTAKAVKAAGDFGCSTIVVGGGFSANSRLRELLAERAGAAGIEVRIPPLRFCTDNGAQIAAITAALVANNVAPSPADFSPDSALDLETLSV